jgi:hypothetical protein
VPAAMPATSASSVMTLSHFNMEELPGRNAAMLKEWVMVRHARTI